MVGLNQVGPAEDLDAAALAVRDAVHPPDLRGQRRDLAANAIDR
jgi:hypothetical protein